MKFIDNFTNILFTRNTEQNYESDDKLGASEKYETMHCINYSLKQGE